MMKCIKNNLSLVPFWIIFLLSVIWFIFMYDKGIERLFVTSDRLGYRHYQNQDYLNAAKHFEDISFKAASYYKAAEFKNAKALYQNLTTKEGVYNLGNTFVMLGDYDNAIQAYKRALKIDPNFEEAQENLLVAQVRKTLKEPIKKA